MNKRGRVGLTGSSFDMLVRLLINKWCTCMLCVLQWSGWWGLTLRQLQGDGGGGMVSDDVIFL